MSRIQIFLSRRWTGIAFTIISVIAINSWQQVMESFGWDNSFSLAAAKNISEGHGYSIAMASSSDYSKVYYEPLNKWPPGYSFLLLLIRKITGTDWIHTAYLLNGIALTAFVVVFRRMLFQLEFPIWIINVAVLCFGFIPHGFSALNYSDIVSVLLFMLGCSFLIRYIRSGQQAGGLIFASVLCFAYCAWLKYIYIVISLVPLTVVFCYGYFWNRKKTKQMALVGSFFLFILIGLLLIYQQNHTGNVVFIHPSETGFFPDQLLLAAPVVPGSFINTYFYNLQILKYCSIALETMDRFWTILHVICLLWIMYVIRIIYKKGYLRRENAKSFYVILAISISTAIYIFLAILTVRINKHYADMTWVYIQEIRYYAPVCFMLQQFAVFLFLKPHTFFSKTGTVLFRTFLMLILIEEVSHGTYFMIKQIFIKREFGEYVKNELPYLKAIQLTQNEILRGNRVIVCSNSLVYTNICSLSGSSSINDLQTLNKKMLASKPMTIITVINQKEQPIIQDFISKTNTKLESRMEYEGGTILYFITNLPKNTDTENLPDHTRL
jgi:hypothetical protein